MNFLDPATWTGRIFLNGWRTGSGGVREVIEPATGHTLGRVGVAAPKDVALAAEQAAVAQRAWAGVPFDAKAAILRKAGDLFAQHAEEIHGWIIREIGAIPGMAAYESGFAIKACYEAAGLCSLPFGDVLRTPSPRLSFARRLPVGVVGVIAPFNVPIVLSMRAIAPALALGNAVVVKPDPRASVAGGVVLARIFEEAGLPEGLLSVLPGGADVGEAMVADPNIAVIAFTGSTRAGRMIARAAASSLKRVHLELGGKSSLIVLDDADLDKAVSLGAWGAFLHQGQICMASGRHLVHRSLYSAYVGKLAAKADHLPVGDPATAQVALGEQFGAPAGVQKQAFGWQLFRGDDGGPGHGSLLGRSILGRQLGRRQEIGSCRGLLLLKWEYYLAFHAAPLPSRTDEPFAPAQADRAPDCRQCGPQRP